MRPARFGDHSNAGRVLLEGLRKGPSFMSDPRRSCAPHRGIDPDVFFKEDSISTARAICGSCIFQNQCKAWAAQYHIKWGVWGGVNRDPRKSRRHGE